MVEITRHPGGLTPLQRPTGSARDPLEVGRQFEAAMLAPMVDEMLRSAGEEMMGAGQSAGLWRSFMAGAIAEQIVASGGTGIAEMVAGQLGKDRA